MRAFWRKLQRKGVKMTINEIIKKSLQRLKQENKLLTPDNYSEIFCEEAKRSGMVVEDCNALSTYMNMLDEKSKKSLQSYRVKSVKELVRFLTSQLRLANPTLASELNDALFSLVRSMAQSIEMLHNSEATKIAQEVINNIKNMPSVAQIEHLKKSWLNFMTLYDDSFLERLSQYGTLDKKSLHATITQLRNPAVQGEGGSSESVALLVASLVPSIASSVNDKLAALSETLRQDPDSVATPSVQKRIKEAIALRITLDKRAFEKMVGSVDSVIEELSAQIISMIEQSSQSVEEIKQIKTQLQDVKKLRDEDFVKAHRKLFIVANSLQERSETFSQTLQLHQEHISGLNHQVEQLQKELDAAKKSSQEDFLTKLYNKRALQQFLELKEAEYLRHNSEYCIVMFDIDYFKRVNDTYGHEAGDIVLKGFAKILQRSKRTDDIVGRFGGEEFMAILSKNSLDGALQFANKVLENVRKARIVYNNEKVAITCSAGVAMRSQYNTQQATINGADERLYEAKNSGRDRVVPGI